ncbi:MAG: DUF4139 domain-containing protein [Bacteroidetes bacterium]|nr:DUF4139 domain-containing protein [Bacteroidota bacterium]
MKKLTIGILAILFHSAAFAAEVDLNTKVESVTIYHSGALVTRTGTQDLEPGINQLVFRNLSSKIILNSIKISNKEVTILNRSLIRKLTTEELNQLLDKKEALQKQMSLIESKYNETGFVAKVEDLEKMTAFYSNKTLQIKRELREADKKIEDARKLEEIELKNENAAILKLIVSIDGTLKTPLRMQYVCGGIGWSPAYEISVESSSDKSIEVKYLAKVMSQTGEDWEDVVINLSSSFPLGSPTKLPKPSSPWVLAGKSFIVQSSNQSIGQRKEQKEIGRLEGVEYQEISIPSYLKLRTLKGKYSLKSNSTVFTFPINTVNLPAYFYYYGFPSIDPETYLVAEVIGWDTLGFVDGIANITFSGNDVGKSIIKFSETQDTLLLPVGKDNSVFLKRSEIADKKYFKVTKIAKKKKTTFAFQYDFKNNNSFPVQFELVDQVPISQTKYAEVEIEKITNGQLNRETGEVVWQMELKPGESVKKELIFTIEMDADYQYKRAQVRKRYDKIYAPML